MQPLALALFVLCASAGLLTVALLARWLRTNTKARPDIELDDEPVASIFEPMHASHALRAASDAAARGDVEPTQPMTHAGGNWSRTEWPSTLAFAPSQPAADTQGPASEFADTQPLPVETSATR